MSRKKSFFNRIVTALGKEFDENPIKAGVGFLLIVGTIGIIAYIMLGGSFSANIEYDDIKAGFNAGQPTQVKQ